jgi:predicted nucleic acid-binding protein
VIVDASALIDAVADSGARGAAARRALSQQGERLSAPGLLAVEVLAGLRRLAADDAADFHDDDIPAALEDAEGFGVEIEGTPWSDVRRAWELSAGSVRYTDGVYIAHAERSARPLLTSDGRLSRSGAKVHCTIIHLDPADG